MALIKCPECNNDVSNSANSCPHCGYNIKEFIEKQEKENELKEREQLIEKQKLIKEEKRKNKEEKIIAFYRKYLGTTKQKIIAIVVPFLVICIIVSLGVTYSIVKKDYIEIKKDSVTCVEKIEYIDEKIYEYLEFEGNKRYIYVNSFDFSYADRLIGRVRNSYSKLSDSDKSNFDSYLKRNYGITWDELNEKYTSYGLVANSESDAINNDDEYYQNMIDKKREEYEESLGEVKVTSKTSNYTNNKFIISGTVKNTTQDKVTFVKVKVVLMNDEFETLNTDNTYAVGDEGLLPGESTTFTCYIDDVAGVTKFNAYVYDYKTE